MIPKIKTDNFMMWLVLLMQLGFHTNTGYDDIVSIVVSVVVFCYFVFTSTKNGRISMTSTGKEFAVWYTVVMGLCGISFIWATHGNKPFILEMFLNTFIPVMITMICISQYLKRGNTGQGLMTALITAEIFVTIRALINTDVGQLLSQMNTRLYGIGLGVNYNHFTTQFALVLCVVLFMAYYINRLYYIPAAFIVLNILVSGSRKVLIASAIMFLFMYLISSKSGSLGKRIRTAVVIVVILGAGIWFILNNSFLNDLTGQKTMVALREMFYMDVDKDTDYSVYQRAELMKTALEVFRSHPIIGVGYYCFLNYNEWQLYAHNNYLELMADLGLVGLLAYYSFYITNIFRFLGINISVDGLKFGFRKSSRRSSWNVLGLTFMFTLMFLEYGQVTFFRPYALVPLMVVIFGIENMKSREAQKRSA